MGMVWMIVAFIIQTGSKNKTWKEYDDSFAAWVGAACGAGAGLLTLLLVMPILKRRIDRAHERLDKCAWAKPSHLRQNYQARAKTFYLR